MKTKRHPKVWIKPETWLFNREGFMPIRYQYRRNGQVWSYHEHLKYWRHDCTIPLGEFRGYMLRAECTRI